MNSWQYWKKYSLLFRLTIIMRGEQLLNNIAIVNCTTQYIHIGPFNWEHPTPQCCQLSVASNRQRFRGNPSHPTRLLPIACQDKRISSAHYTHLSVLYEGCDCTYTPSQTSVSADTRVWYVTQGVYYQWPNVQPCIELWIAPLPSQELIRTD